MDLEKKYKTKIITLLSALFPDAKIFIYGSRARGDHHAKSDIDIALDAGEKIPDLALGEAQSILEGSYIPYRIDLIDIHGASQHMRDAIKNELKIWKD